MTTTTILALQIAAWLIEKRRSQPFFCMGWLGMQVLFFALVTIPSAAAVTDADVFRPPGPALIHTKYAQDCGGVSKDLRSEMPPVEDQKKSGWCASYATKSLLEYYLHSQNPRGPYPSLSVADINSLDVSSSAKEKGQKRIPNFAESGANPGDILVGVQDAGAVFSDKDLSLNTDFFADGGILDRIFDYYNRESPFAAEPGGLACREHEKSLDALESSFPDILKILKFAKNKRDFAQNLARNHPFVRRGLSAKRSRIHPPFDISQIGTPNGDEYMDFMRQALQENRPVVATICAAQLVQDPQFAQAQPLDQSLSRACGAHALLITGMKKLGGSCMVQLRSSWGTAWPKSWFDSGGGGYGWIPVSDFLKIMATSPGGLAEGLTIMKRKGKLTNNSAHLRFGDGTVVDGLSHRNALVSGQISSANGDRYEGEVREVDSEAGGMKLIPRHKGVLLLANGAEERGDFFEGRLLAGTFKGPTQTSGIFYEGEVKNGHAAGGRFFDSTGKTLSGSYSLRISGWHLEAQ